MANPIDLSALILSVARSCDEAIQTLKKSNAEVELDQVEMTVTIEADIDDEALRAPARPGAAVLPGLRLDLKSRVIASRVIAGRPNVLPTPGRTPTTPSTPARPTATAVPASTSDDSDVTGRIELRLLLSRKE